MEYRSGQLVRSLTGRDKGLFFAVIAADENRVWVANGRERRIARPKAKNRGHLAPTSKFVSESALTSDKLLNQAIAELTAAPAIS